jgi:alpha-1,2-mannosyltransferase
MELAARPSASTRIVAVLAVAALGVTIWLYCAYFWGGSEPFYFFDTDFYRRAVVSVMTGDKPMYEAMAYPPFAYLLIWWLPSVPMVIGDQIVTAATFVVIIAVGVLLTIRALEATGQNWRNDRWDLAIRASVNSILLLISMPMFSQLTCGQFSVFVAALAFADVAGVVPKRFQGVLVGLAAAIKVTPMIFAVYYLVTGQRRQAAVSVGSFAAFTSFGALFFPAETWTFWTRLTGTGQDIDPTLPYNLGIRSTLERLSPGLGDVTWAWAGLGLILMIVTLWRARKLYRRDHVMEAILIVGAAAIVVPPNALPHYFIWLPMAGIWLVMTGTRTAKWLGAAIYLVYSLLYYFVVLPALVNADRIWWNGLGLVTLIPVLMGIFGLPSRPGLTGTGSPGTAIPERRVVLDGVLASEH